MADMVTIRVQMPSGGKVDRRVRADLVDAIRTDLEPQGYVLLVLPERKTRPKPIDLPSHEEIEETLLDVVNLQTKLVRFRSSLEKAWLATKEPE